MMRVVHDFPMDMAC
jgi:hypothetical protein